MQFTCTNSKWFQTVTTLVKWKQNKSKESQTIHVGCFFQYIPDYGMDGGRNY